MKMFVKLPSRCKNKVHFVMQCQELSNKDNFYTPGEIVKMDYLCYNDEKTYGLHPLGWMPDDTCDVISGREWLIYHGYTQLIYQDTFKVLLILLTGE